MKEYKYLFGPVPSRRMGLSIGVSPIPKKYCNYSCIYCQLGRTNHLTNERKSFFEVEDILKEFKDYLKSKKDFDVVTVVGEGEPTLYKDLGKLIIELKKHTTKPVAVITNGGLLNKKEVRDDLKNADIVLPSFDACDEEIFKKVDRAHGRIKFSEIYEGLIDFSNEYEGQLWIETMIMKDVNDDEESLMKMRSLLDKVKYDRLYINTPVRPPAEQWVEQVSSDKIALAVNILKGISIDMLDSKGFASEVEDDYEAIISIIRRHPMNQYEIRSFLESRSCNNIETILERLKEEKNVDRVAYKGYDTYRFI